MDYLLLSTLNFLQMIYLLVSYDIACQFSKNFLRRIKSYSQNLQKTFKDLRWAIPKKHIAVHGPNHSKYSLNFLRWVARTYGEGIESGWSYNNPLAGATSEMGTGMRHEVIDDNWNAWNWHKTMTFGTKLFSTQLANILSKPENVSGRSSDTSDNTKNRVSARSD